MCISFKKNSFSHYVVTHCSDHRVATLSDFSLLPPDLFKGEEENCRKAGRFGVWEVIRK